jgi:hypothetical protein
MTSLSIHPSDPTLFTHFKRGVQKNGGQTFHHKALPNDYKIVSFVRRLFNMIGACITGIGLVIGVPFVWIGSIFHWLATPGKVYMIAGRILDNEELELHLTKVADSKRKLKTLHITHQGEGSLIISKRACCQIGKILPQTLVFNRIELSGLHEKWLETSTHYYLQKEATSNVTTYILKRKISAFVLPKNHQDALGILRKLAQAKQRVAALHYMTPFPEEYEEERKRLLDVIRPAIQTYIVEDAKLTAEKAMHALLP